MAITKKRVITRITFADYKKLQRICKLYKFRSIYQLVAALISIFLAHTCNEEDQRGTVPNEFVEMFKELEAEDCEYRNIRREQL